MDFGVHDRVIEMLETNLQVKNIANERLSVVAPMVFPDDAFRESSFRVPSIGSESLEFMNAPFFPKTTQTLYRNSDGVELRPTAFVVHKLERLDAVDTQTAKYWVHNTDLPRILTTLSKNMAVCVAEGGEDIWETVSVVHMDNCFRQFVTDRSTHQSSATMIRFVTSVSDPTNTRVERKVFGPGPPSPSGPQAFKDSFSIESDKIVPLLQGHRFQGTGQTDKLLTEFQSAVHNKKLFPVLRARHDRMVFEPVSLGQEGVRVHVDTRIKFFQDRIVRSEDKPDKVVKDSIKHTPFAIVEIVLKEPYITHPPVWLKALQADPCMHRENEFSKYVHGSYAFQNMEGNSLCLPKPCWWDKMVARSPQMAQEKPEVKVETPPKTWFETFFTNAKKKKTMVVFACERTFLAWFGPAAFVCSFGVSVDVKSGDEKAGKVLVGLGVVLIAYAMVNYLTRWGPSLNTCASLFLS